MRVKFENNTLTVVTDIAKETIEKAVSKLAARDEKGNELFTIQVSHNGDYNISEFGLICNAFVDNKLAIVAPMPLDFTLDNVKALYGKCLVKAREFGAVIATQAQAEAAAIESLFEGDNAVEYTANTVNEQ